MNLQIPVSIGELLDKITILDIKSRYTSNKDKTQNVLKELTLLKGILTDLNIEKDITDLYKQLYDVNLLLWHLEDQIRDYDDLKKFDQDFIETARAIYNTNDKRSQIKKTINIQLGSEIIEEKFYERKI